MSLPLEPLALPHAPLARVAATVTERLATSATSAKATTNRNSDRKRASKACKNCNLKKIKCQFESGGEVATVVVGLQKCKSCKDGGLDCEFIERKKRGPKSKSSLYAHSASDGAAPSINTPNLVVDQSSSYTSSSSSSTAVALSSSFSFFDPLQQQTFATSSKPTISQVQDLLQVKSTLKPKSFVGTMHFPSSAPIISRYEDIEVWKHMDFYMSQIPDQKGGGSLAFLDYYFKYVYIEIPIFSKNCLEGHLTDLPLWLLHSMFACCFITPLPSNGRIPPDRALKHMKYAIKQLHQDLENVDPFYCCALLHAAAFYARLDNDAWVAHLTLCVQICYQLRMDVDTDVVWFSRSGKRLQSIDMCRGIWIMAFFFDFYCQFSSKHPMIIKGSITESIVNNYLPVNSDHPTNIPENFLTYYKYQLPLVELSKRKLVMDSKSEYLSFDTAEELIEGFDNWFHVLLPSSFRYSKFDAIWKSRFTCMLNLLYISNKLDILVPYFISAISGLDDALAPTTANGNSSRATCEKYMSHMVELLAIVSVICRSFLDYKANGGQEEPLRETNLLHTTVFKATVVLIACLSRVDHQRDVTALMGTSQEISKRIRDHCSLLSFIQFGGGKESLLLKELLEDPAKSLDVICNL